MSFKRTVRRVLLAASLALAAAAFFHSTSAEAGLKDKCQLQTGCCLCCPACDHVCRLDAEQVEEEIPCFDVESKVICIPRVVFPWQKKKCLSCDSCDGRGCTNCVHNGARTRRICVLKTDKYKCPKCKYTWTAEKKPCGGCDSGCDSCCDAGQIQVIEGTQLQPAAPQTAAPAPVPGFLEAATTGPQTVFAQ